MITYGSVCSGIEAATVAWHPLGWQAAWFSEIEKFTSSVLAHHYPKVPNLGDMTLIAQKIRSGEVAPPDILVGGTPCQAFSVAGLRGGLADPRGQLSLSYVDLINAIDEKRTTPTIAVWENVPGVLSSKDNAFGCFLGALAGGSKPLLPTGRRWSNAGYIVGSKRSIAWRILDAQYFGVPQRRRRVFVIASARKDVDPAEILFEFDGLCRDIAPSRGAQETITGTLTSSTFSGGISGKPDEAAANHIEPYTSSSFGTYREGVGTLTASGGNLGGGSETLALTLTSSQGRLNPETGTDPSANIVAYAFDSLSSNSMKSPNPNSGCNVVDVSKTIDTRGLNPSCNQGGNAVMHNITVRRLTPVECERLQGFPDNYTNIPNATDTSRYKALGNSMAVPVMWWLGERINDFI